MGEYECEKVDMVLGNGEQRQVCVAPAQSLGISTNDEGVLHAMMKKMAGLSDKISQFSGKYSFGFVGDFKEVLVRSYALDKMQLSAVDELSIPVESMRVPENYSAAEIVPSM